MAEITEQRLLYRLDEAAERLGVSRATIYKLIASGELVVVRLKTVMRIPASELDRYVAQLLADAKAALAEGQAAGGGESGE